MHFGKQEQMNRSVSPKTVIMLNLLSQQSPGNSDPSFQELSLIKIETVVFHISQSMYIAGKINRCLHRERQPHV